MYLTTEGKLPFANFSTWYKITGDGDKTPLLTLHGGPGSGSDYLHSLDHLSEDGRKIIYYDQLGCGRSPADSDPSRWTFFESIGYTALNKLKYHVTCQQK